MIHIIDGTGKGKTSAAVGMCVRAIGHGWDVLFVQFLKDDHSGEITVLKQLGVKTMHAPKDYGFSYNMNAQEMEETRIYCRSLIEDAFYSSANLIVLDEVLWAINEGYIKKSEMEPLLSKTSEIVLTGRVSPLWIREKADYISTITSLRHPYERGILAREGVEY